MRNHVVHVSDSGLITIAGGKWTTYRAMASETVDAAVKEAGMEPVESRTDGLLLEGAHNWNPTMFIQLVQVPIHFFSFCDAKKDDLAHWID